MTQNELFETVADIYNNADSIKGKTTKDSKGEEVEVYLAERHGKKYILCFKQNKAVAYFPQDDFLSTAERLEKMFESF
jgi:hypothetical protein